MHKFPIFNYKRFRDLPIEQLDNLRFSIYIVDFEWNYLFVNAFACRLIKKKLDELKGKNMWQTFRELESDTSFMQLKKNAENGFSSDITTLSPVTGQRINIKDYRLEDCHYFAVSILPNKESLMDELRDALAKNKFKK